MIMGKRYSDDFKKDAVLMLESGMTQRQVCEGLGISRAALQSWLRADRLARRGIPVPADREEAASLAVAMRRIRELEMENKVLRRAAAYLSQAELHSPK